MQSHKSISVIIYIVTMSLILRKPAYICKEASMDITEFFSRQSTKYDRRICERVDTIVLKINNNNKLKTNIFSIDFTRNFGFKTWKFHQRNI